MDDPRAVLGVGPTATAEEVARARRRLAKSLHPDLHDERSRAEAERRMAQVNQAYDAVRAAGAAAAPADAGGHEPEGRAAGDDGRFSIAALPVDAFELVLLAAVELGDVIRAEEPYLLAVLVDHPGPCQCVVDLVPDAGSTTVSIDLAPRHYGECPPLVAVRDALVAEIVRQGAALRRT